MSSTTVGLADLADYATRGKAPPVDECIEELASERLWQVSDGGVVVGYGTGTCDYDGLAAVSDAEGLDPDHPLPEGWEAARVARITGTLCDGAVMVEAWPHDIESETLCITLTTSSGLLGYGADFLTVLRAAAKSFGVEVNDFYSTGTSRDTGTVTHHLQLVY